MSFFWSTVKNTLGHSDFSIETNQPLPRDGSPHLRIREKTEEKSNNFSLSQGSDPAGSYIRSSDGLGEDGELTPSTKKTALEAMRKVLSRCEYTPRTPRDLDEEMDAEEREIHETSCLGFEWLEILSKKSLY